MGSERRWRTLGELTDNFDSFRVPVKASDRRPGTYPYYGASGVVDHVDQYLYDGEYLLIAEDGENLKTRTTPIAFLARGRFWVNNHAHVVRGNSQADTRFLMYALAAADVNGYLSGSAMPKLTQASLNRIPLFVPELAEQRRVADMLAALDDKIELNRRMCQTLESMARALFKSWFVDFGSVHDGAFGEIAQVWREALDPGQFPNQQFDHYSLPAFDASGQPLVASGSEIRSIKFRVPWDAVLLSKLNPEIDRVWLVDADLRHTSVCSTEFMVLRARPPHGRAYLYSLAASAGFRAELQVLATGTSNSHQRAQPDLIMKLLVPVPSVQMAEEFERVVGPILDRKNRATRDCRALTSLRDELLPRLMSRNTRLSAQRGTSEGSEHSSSQLQAVH